MFFLVSAQALQCQARTRSLPLPRALQDLLAHRQGNGPAQDRARKGRPQEAGYLRGNARTLRQEEANGRARRTQGSSS